jgi:hypothetical protein
MVPDICFQDEMQEATQILLLQATSTKCVCGEAKDADWPFCRSCSRRAKRVHPRIIDSIRIRLNRGGDSAKIIAMWSYDLAVDYLTNAAPMKRRQEED